MARRPSTLGMLLKLGLLLAPLVCAVLFGPRLVAQYAPGWFRSKVKWTRLVDGPAIESGVGSGGSTARPGGDSSGPDGSAAPAPVADAPAPIDPETAAACLARLEKDHLGHSTVITPQEGKANPSGERVRRFQGFGVSVESRPTGATVLVNGEEVGETPIVTSVECTPGAPVTVEVRKGRHAPARRVTRCRQDELVEYRVELR